MLKRFYTEGEIKKAIRMRDDNVSWAEIGEVLDRTPGSIAATVSYYRAGKWAPHRFHERSLVLNKQIELWVARGMSTGRMAQAAGLAKSTIQDRLLALGFDYETRTEIAPIVDHKLDRFPRESSSGRFLPRSKRGDGDGQEADRG